MVCSLYVVLGGFVMMWILKFLVVAVTAYGMATFELRTDAVIKTILTLLHTLPTGSGNTYTFRALDGTVC